MTQSVAPNIQSVGQIAINVHDTNRAVEFYRDVLGLKLLFTAGQLAFFDCGVRLMLSPPSSPEHNHPSSILYFKVADIQLAYMRLLQMDVKTEGEPALVAKMPDHDLWLVGFRDSEGNVMEFMSEVRRAVT
jgi:catechol 2,3-dioxygenase-like lactoylglutathione lyase family enzyme